MTPPADQLARLVHWVNSIAAIAANDPRALASREHKARLRRAVLSASRRAIEDARPVIDGEDAVPLRLRAVMRARELVRERLSQPISLVDLCGAAQVRARTLEYGFRELYGTSPIAYIRCERLCRVHDDLLEADRAATSVTATAARWGFAHMSQFAKDYRTLFGESPSATLFAQGHAASTVPGLHVKERRTYSAA